VEQVIWRSTHTFQDVQLPYRVACSLDHTWQGTATASNREPVVDTSVELFSDEWDLKMLDTTQENGSREWGEVTEAFFPSTATESGLEALIGSAEKMQSILSTVQREEEGLTKTEARAQ
jgi:hypothetical protein